MLKLEWNALREGHRLYVHDFANKDRAEEATVAFVHMAHGENDLGVRITDAAGRSHVVWPSRLVAHLEPVADPGSCWRCEVMEDHDRLVGAV